MPVPAYWIVLVDDDGVSNFLNRSTLEEAGIPVQINVFASPVQALAFFQKGQADPGNTRWPDLLVVDLHMPEMNGYEMIEALQGQCPALFAKSALCILTTSQHPRDLQKAKDLNVDLFFEKPLTQTSIDQMLFLVDRKRSTLNALAKQPSP